MAGKDDDTLQQVHNYVKEKDINAIYVDMTEQMLLHRPDFPIRFMIDYLTHKHDAEVKAGYYTRKEEEGKGEEGVKWEYKKGSPPGSANERSEDAADDDLDMSSDEDDEDDYIDELPTVKPRKQRIAISATQADMSNFSPVSVPKSDEERKHIMDILTSNNFFSNLTEDQRAMMADCMSAVQKADGEDIIKQGDQGDNFYILDKGAADVWVAKDGEEAQKVFTYEEGSGAAFGELALLYNAPRAATVRAVGEVKLWALDQNTFRYSMRKQTTETRSQNTEWISKVPLLADLTEVEKMSIADALKQVKFSDGEVIIKQGDKGDNFYILKSGECSCTIKSSTNADPVEVLRVTEGGYFGEIALLTDQARKASVTAVGDVVALSLDRGTFKRVMGPLTNILQRNMDNYKQVLQQMGM